VALADTADAVLGLERVEVVLAAAPGHKDVETPAERRLELVRAAFPRRNVLLDEHARTIDLLRDRPDWHGATFLLGADEFGQFLSWKEPNEVLELVSLAVAARPGYDGRALFEPVLAGLAAPDRVRFFALEQPVSSTELREQLRRGEDVSAELPPAVWELCIREGLYGRPPGYTGAT
jgi:nicotinate-nucleotide adenylyltransferase